MIKVPAQSQISKANERMYHQSNLLGDWKGTWTKNNQAVEFKVLNIRGNQAEVEYTHNGHTERGIAKVDGVTITFGNVTIGTKNGRAAALEFSAGSAKMTAVLSKQDQPADQNKLVGSWSGFSRDNGQSAFFQVVSVDGKDAQVKFTANGNAMETGGAIVDGNTVIFGNKAQFTSNDGNNGHIVFQGGGHRTYSVPVTKNKAVSASSTSVNKLA